jgi:hypothetical protein
MAEDRAQSKTVKEIEAELAAAAQRAKTAKLNRTDRSKGEQKSKGRINARLLRPGAGACRDMLFTVRANRDKVEAVKALAEELSQPRSKVSVAALLEEAIDLLLEHYENQRSGGMNGGVENS